MSYSITIFYLIFYLIYSINGQVVNKGLILGPSSVGTIIYPNIVGNLVTADNNFLYVTSQFNAAFKLQQYSIADVFNPTVTSLTPTPSFPSKISDNVQVLSLTLYQNYIFISQSSNLEKDSNATQNPSQSFWYLMPENTPPNFCLLSNGYGLIVSQSGENPNGELILISNDFSVIPFVYKAQVSVGFNLIVTSSMLTDEANKKVYMFFTDKILVYSYNFSPIQYQSTITLTTTIPLSTPIYSLQFTNNNMYYFVANSDSTSYFYCAVPLSNIDLNQPIFSVEIPSLVPLSTASFPPVVYDKKLNQVLYIYSTIVEGVQSYTLSSTIDNSSANYTSKLYSNLPAPNGIQPQIGIARNPANNYQQSIVYTSGNQLIAVPYESFCPLDCSGNGYCQDLICQCDQQYYGPGCQYVNPKITLVMPIIYKSGKEITIMGTDFLVPIVTLDASVCEITSSNLTEILCTVPETFTYQANNSYTLVVDFNNGLKQITKTFNFLLPQILSYAQNEKIVSITTKNLLNTTYSLVYNNIQYPYSFISSQELQIKLPKNVTSGSLAISCSICPTFQNINVQLVPIIDSVSPTTIFYYPTKVTFDIWFYNNTQISIYQGPNQEFTMTPNQNQKFIITTILDSIDNTEDQYFQVSSPPTLTKSLKTQYSYIEPEFIDATQTDTDVAMIQSIGFGEDSHNFLIYFNGDENIFGEVLSFSSRDSNTNFTVSIPNNTITGSVTMKMQGFLYGGTIQLQPIIESVEPRPSIIGGKVTITGHHLPNNFTIGLVSLTCENITVATKYECNILPGSGEHKITVSSLEQQDNITLQYQSPTITSISPNNVKLSSNNTFTISGDQFSVSSLQVEIGGTECLVFDNELVNINEIICQWVSPNTKPSKTLLSVFVSVDGLEGSKNLLQLSIDCPSSTNSLECGGQGKCQRNEGICTCNSGFTGNTCELVDEISNSNSLNSNIYSLFLILLLNIIYFII